MSYIPIPNDYIISKKFLRGISNNAFLFAFDEIQKLIYEIELSDNNIKDKHAVSKTINGLVKNGDLCDGKLYCNVNNMQYQKWEKYNLIFQAMSEKGFVFDGLGNNYALKNITEFILSYPKNPDVFIVLKSYDGLESLYWAKLSDDWNDERNYAALYLYLSLQNEKEKVFYKMIHDKLKASGLKHTLNENGSGPIHYHYKGKKSGKDFLFNRGWIFHVRLHHIHEYMDVFNDCTENVKNIILSGEDCNDCPKQCGNAYQFTYKGKDYSKIECYMNCFKFPVTYPVSQNNFVIPELTIGDVSSVEKLLDAELSFM